MKLWLVLVDWSGRGLRLFIESLREVTLLSSRIYAVCL